MKNKNLALVAVLFTISVIMAFANGPTPQVVIDTDQIVDGAVTILKTDGVAANDLSNVTPATGRAALGLGTISTKAATDYVATSALALRLDTTNASISNNLDVTGDVGAATVNGVAPLTINTVATIEVDSQTGVVTSATGTATYAIHGKLMFISATSKVTDAGTGSSFLRLWLPASKTASARSFLSAYDIGTGKAAIAYVNASGGVIYVIQPDYTTTLVANGAEVVVTGWIPIN